MTVLVTGAAGFIGAHLCKRLLDEGETVVGMDDLNPYYDPALKHARLGWLDRPQFRFHHSDVAEASAFAAVVERERPRCIIHLAAQAGVRYSIENPFAYERANVAGHLSVLEAVRHALQTPQLLYASSSSVYGDRAFEAGRGFREDDPVDQPVSLYAATKRSCELFSAAYANLYGIASTGLRFFTVYGPWGRPDMAYYLFADAILRGEPIEVFGQGEMARDFTYIDDIVDGITALMNSPTPEGEHRLFNIGDSRPCGLMTMIEILEKALGMEAKKIMKPMQPGDVTATYADISRLNALTGYAPKTPLEEGLPRFVAWRRGYEG